MYYLFRHNIFYKFNMNSNNTCKFCQIILKILHLIFVCMIFIFGLWLLKQFLGLIYFLYRAFKIFGFADNILAFLLSTNSSFDTGHPEIQVCFV